MLCASCQTLMDMGSMCSWTQGCWAMKQAKLMSSEFGILSRLGMFSYCHVFCPLNHGFIYIIYWFINSPPSFYVWNTQKFEMLSALIKYFLPFPWDLSVPRRTIMILVARWLILIEWDSQVSYLNLKKASIGKQNGGMHLMQ
jgi:hypothetical protein